jgi:hypothetical protein
MNEITDNKRNPDTRAVDAQIKYGKPHETDNAQRATDEVKKTEQDPRRIASRMRSNCR